MGVETAFTAASLLGAGATTVGSFTQAAKQKKLANQAAQDAEKAIADARAKLDVNYYEQLAVQKEPYREKMDRLLSQGAQAIQAGVESERGAAATAGRIQMAQEAAQEEQRSAMGKELSDLAKLTVAEESRLRDLKTDLDISEATAERLRERDANRARAAAIQQGFAGVTSMLQTAAPLIPLYLKQRQDKKALKEAAFNPEKDIKSDTGNDFNIPEEGQRTFGGLSMEDIGKMSDQDYQNFIKNLSPEEKAALFSQKNIGPSNSSPLYEEMNPFALPK